VEAFARTCFEDGLARGFTQDALLHAFAAIRQQRVDPVQKVCSFQ
jgi:hypothetical protein